MAGLDTSNTPYHYPNQGVATKVRDNHSSVVQPTRDDRMDTEAALYNTQNTGAPLIDRTDDARRTGLRTHMRQPGAGQAVAVNDARAAMKDALAAAHGFSRPKDFPAFQPTKPTGVARVTHPDDTPLFVPKPDPQPARRLHDLPDDYLAKIWAEDKRKEQLAKQMVTDTDHSPIKALRRGDAHLMEVAGRTKKNFTDVSHEPEKPSGRQHNVVHNQSQIQLSSECVAPVVSGRRRINPYVTKGSNW